MLIVKIDDLKESEILLFESIGINSKGLHSFVFNIRESIEGLKADNDAVANREIDWD